MLTLGAFIIVVLGAYALHLYMKLQVQKAEKKQQEEVAEQFKDLVERVKTNLEERVEDVRITCPSPECHLIMEGATDATELCSQHRRFESKVIGNGEGRREPGIQMTLRHDA